MAGTLLNDGASLRELQEYVQKTSTERGFDEESVQDRFILLVEEVGELAKALREIHGVKFAADTSRREIENEIADVQLLLASLSNKLGVDIEASVQNKEQKNRLRSWS